MGADHPLAGVAGPISDAHQPEYILRRVDAAGLAAIAGAALGRAMIPIMFSGLEDGLQNGGSACLKHYILRFLLWSNDYAPLNYIRFLDYATERVFLRKVGGGYIFTHRLLMEYFATLEPIEQAGQAGQTKVE
jgi:hypothetical protein